VGIWVIVCIQKTVSPLFEDISPTTFVEDYVPQWFTLLETVVFVLSALTDQRKLRQNVGL